MSTQNFEQMMNLYSGIKTVCAVAAIVFFLAAVALFFLLKIPSVFGELTGRTAQKAIEEMTSESHSGSLGASRKIGEDGLRQRKKVTGILGTSRLKRKTGNLSGSLATDRLNPADSSTDIYKAEVQKENNAVNTSGENYTTVMAQGSIETTVLERRPGPGGFLLERSIVDIHTDEVI